MCVVPQMVHITPHGGVAPPMPSHSQSGQQQQQQQQQTPQQPTSSGHQTPTPSQHTPYPVQQVGPGVGVMPSAAGTPPQPFYHVAQHPVIAPQGPAPPSPQVCTSCQCSQLRDDEASSLSRLPVCEQFLNNSRSEQISDPDLARFPLSGEIRRFTICQCSLSIV